MKLIHFGLLLLAVALRVSQTSAQWVQRGLSGRGIGEIAAGSAGIFAITSDSGSAFRSSDGETSWVQILESQTRHIAVAPNGIVFMATSGVFPQQDSLSRSTDGGNSWTGLYPFDKMPKGRILSIAVGPNGTVFCGVNSFVASPAIGVSTDGGLSWISPGGDTTGGVGFAFHGDSVITATEFYLLEEPKGGFELSADRGLTWQPGDLWPRFSGIFAWCSNGNIIWSAIGGWLHFPGAARIIPSLSALLALPRGGVLAGSDGTGIYLFSDTGDSLGTANEGLTDLHILSFALDSAGNAYAGTEAGVWRRRISEIVSVEGAPVNIPSSFALDQNYPNPFNPSTTIRYELPKSVMVRLSVYDILGREVAVLVNERKNAGSYDVKFSAKGVGPRLISPGLRSSSGGDASGLSSGVYIYRIQAGDFIQARKLLLLK